MIKYELTHENAKSPVKGTESAAGYDLHAAEILRDTEAELWIDTGVAFQIPRGYFGDLRARSSVSETGLILANGAGVVDSDYRGTIQFRFYKVGVRSELIEAESTIQKCGDNYHWTSSYEVGDRIGQIIFQQHHSAHALYEVDDLSETTRGTGGFGSTGV